MIEINGLAEVDINEAPTELPTIVQEGKAKVSFSSSLDVFYNPVQEFNRDLSIAAVRLFASDYRKIKENKTSEKILFKPEDFQTLQSHVDIVQPGIKDNNGIRILEALAASGLRSIRYAQEVGGVKEIIANDYSRSAVSCMTKNVALNQVAELVSPSCNDANMVMYQNRDLDKRFQVVDLDPYGSPHIFLDTAVQCIQDGGILLVTATDMAVLCGKCPETCHNKYGSVSIPMSACHEMALRILLQSIEHHANKYGRYVEPLLSLSIDFYCRVIVRVFTSKKKAKESFSKVGLVHSCVGCESIDLQPLGNVKIVGVSVKYLPSTLSANIKCEHCGHRKKTGGPLWIDSIHDKNFVKRLNESLVEEDFNTYKRLKGMLTLAEQELDVPFYLPLDKVYQICKVGAHKIKTMMSPILNAGYKVSLTHARANAIKTDAPMSFIWDIMRELNTSSSKPQKWPSDHPSTQIFSKEITSKVDLAKHPEADSIMDDRGLIRFQINPEKFWGPKCKSTTSILHGDMQAKSKRKQGKRKNKVIAEAPDCKKAKP